MALVNLVYCSEHRLAMQGQLAAEHVNAILRAAIRNNEARGVTGALIIDREFFVQVLEGEQDDVWSTFERTARDVRHSNVGFVRMESAYSRQFARWPMACVERRGETLSIFSPYLRGGRFRPAQMTGREILSLMTDLRPSLSFGQVVYSHTNFLCPDVIMRPDANAHADAHRAESRFRRLGSGSGLGASGY